MYSKIRHLAFLMEAIKGQRVRMRAYKDPDGICVEGQRRMFRERAKCSQNEIDFCPVVKVNAGHTSSGGSSSCMDQISSLRSFRRQP
jgi:hypothetical protein